MIPAEYLAGFADGEGYLGLARIPRRNGSVEYCIRLSIYNTHRPVLDDVQKIWGGTLSIVARKLHAWKTSYALIWTNSAAASVIRKMAPYLIVKQRQAKALLAFDERIQSGHRFRDSKGRLLPLPAFELRAREAIYLKLKQLNQRGTVKRGTSSNRTNGSSRSTVSPKYLAGFLDADGSLMITRARQARSRTYQYRPRISVANTKRHVLDRIQGTYGGVLTDQPARDPKWSHGYQLVWTDGSVERLLGAVREHLIVRACQADILSDFLRERMMRGKDQRVRRPSMETETDDVREILRGRIRELNRRGPPDGLRSTGSTNSRA
jgi:hypothetical protein